MRPFGEWAGAGASRVTLGFGPEDIISDVVVRTRFTPPYVYDPAAPSGPPSPIPQLLKPSVTVHFKPLPVLGTQLPPLTISPYGDPGESQFGPLASAGVAVGIGILGFAAFGLAHGLFGGRRARAGAVAGLERGRGRGRGRKRRRRSRRDALGFSVPALPALPSIPPRIRPFVVSAALAAGVAGYVVWKKAHGGVGTQGLLPPHPDAIEAKAAEAASGNPTGDTATVDAWKAGKNIGPIQVRSVGKDSAGAQLYLRTDAADALEKMIAAAKSDGIPLAVNSAFRSYASQVAIWNKRHVEDWDVNPGARYKTIDEYAAAYGPGSVNGQTGSDGIDTVLGVVARPGTSNHNGGVAADMIGTQATPEPASTYRTRSFLSPGYKWLAKNARYFGFTGAEGERAREAWHWTFVGKDDGWQPIDRDPETGAPTGLV